ncbi:hypothetical protein FHR38_006195 [Micromonospora polyrhachis]|uniref:Uncharacterized protein n=1 Tax=Micromonospora polyrhachis TaxID=1282883 RepID=A0A7W7WT94_9ACTN|nr:hypothetical protein [Micromonospora polyrhachis]
MASVPAPVRDVFTVCLIAVTALSVDDRLCRRGAVHG